MASAKISTKFQVVIPREVRERAGIESGQRVEVLAKGGVITLVPQRPIVALRGLLEGADATEVRDKSDRL